jgi:hypothetical protein
MSWASFIDFEKSSFIAVQHPMGSHIPDNFFRSNMLHFFFKSYGAMITPTVQDS